MRRGNTAVSSPLDSPWRVGRHRHVDRIVGTGTDSEWDLKRSICILVELYRSDSILGQAGRTLATYRHHGVAVRRLCPVSGPASHKATARAIRCDS
jgi:hypothetical protein